MPSEDPYGCISTGHRECCILIKDNLWFGNITSHCSSRKFILLWSVSKWASPRGGAVSISQVLSLSHLGVQESPLWWGEGNTGAAAFPHSKVHSSSCSLNEARNHNSSLHPYTLPAAEDDPSSLCSWQASAGFSCDVQHHWASTAWTWEGAGEENHQQGTSWDCLTSPATAQVKWSLWHSK